IKPTEGMWDMKHDMSGGAAVIGAMQVVGALGLPLHVVGIVPATENLLSGSAFKPGDILRALNGKTIEIHSADAEGRLALGGGPGGVITAAAIMKKFVDYPWVHLDIAGTAWGDDDKGYNAKGATGFGVRLCVEVLRNWK